MKSYKLDDKTIKNITDLISAPLANPISFFKELALKIDQQTQLTFRLLGARSGHEAWLTYNKGKGHINGGTTKTKAGTWKIRYGTNLNAASVKGKKRIEKRKASLLKSTGSLIGPHRLGVKRFSTNSKMLQASGTFRKSFQELTWRTDRKGFTYGTNFPNAEQIMSNPTRQVLFITPKDRQEYANLFLKYVKENIKI